MIKTLGATGAALAGGATVVGSSAAATDGPIPVLDVDPKNPGLGKEVTLDGSDSYDPAGEGIDSHVWTVQHTANGETTNYTGMDEDFSVTFDEPGHWYVNLGVRTPDDRYNSVKWIRTVHESDDQWPIVNISGIDGPVDDGEEVTLTANNGTPDMEIDSYEWMIHRVQADEVTYQGKEITHTFSGDGIRKVTLKGVTPDGTESWETDFVPIVQETDQEPNVDLDNVLNQYSVGDYHLIRPDASDPDGGPITSYQWLLFREGEEVDDAYGEEYELTPEQPGDHRLNLVVEDDERQTATADATFTVTEDTEKVQIVNIDWNNPFGSYYEAVADVKNVTDGSLTVQPTLTNADGTTAEASEKTITAGDTQTFDPLHEATADPPELLFAVADKEQQYSGN